MNTWTDYPAAYFPNGSTLDYVEDAPYKGRTGVLKQSYEGALYETGLAFHYPSEGGPPRCSSPAA
jgi:hypothetical protein